MSWLLRQDAGQTKVEMNAAGWMSADQPAAQPQVSASEMLEGVQNNNKSRLELNGDFIRASQGHSVEGMPVTLQALELARVRP